MRIAISGAHSTGKTTLVQELARALPRARVAEESYITLLGEGVEFGAIPDASDYERLCEHACALYEAPSDGVVLFDRTPADYLAYLLAVGADFAGSELVARVQRSVSGIDLVVFVPIETPDRTSGGDELPRLRRAVDRRLSELWLEDAWGWGAPVVEVRGSAEARAEQVLDACERSERIMQ